MGREGLSCQRKKNSADFKLALTPKVFGLCEGSSEQGAEPSLRGGGSSSALTLVPTYEQRCPTSDSQRTALAQSQKTRQAQGQKSLHVIAGLHKTLKLHLCIFKRSKKVFIKKNQCIPCFLSEMLVPCLQSP